MFFTEELRKCLNAAGLSDCGENDAWNYWYQRVLKAHNEAVERQIATEQAENAKLRELVRDMWRFTGAACKKYPRLFDPSAQGGQMVQPNALESFEQRMRELEVDV